MEETPLSFVSMAILPSLHRERERGDSTTLPAKMSNNAYEQKTMFITLSVAHKIGNNLLNTEKNKCINAMVLFDVCS